MVNFVLQRGMLAQSEAETHRSSCRSICTAGPESQQNGLEGGALRSLLLTIVT